MATKILLTNGDDNWFGTDGADYVDGLKGNDIMDGGLGNDTLLGNLGDDLIAGGGGADTIKGGDGNDVLDGGTENDKLYGDSGDDIVYGGTGQDKLFGGTGDDYLAGGADNDALYGGTGSDAIDGGDGNDVLYDTDNAKTYGALSTENDEMAGGAGNDKFYGGYDTMWGNDGNDTFNVNNQATVYGGTGNDVITVKNTNAKLDSWLEGGLGSDTIVAGAGNDTLFSGYGSDTLKGGDGNDNYVITFDDFFNDDGTVGLGTDTIVDTGGVDTAYYIRDFVGDGRDDDVGSDGKELDPILQSNDFYVTLPNGIENGVLDDQIYVNTPTTLTYWIAWLNGNDLNNNLKGSNLYDVIDGGAGNDTISAGDGNDVVFVGQGKDTVDGGAGSDWIVSSINFNLATDSKNFENIDLLDSPAALSATGDNGNNWIIGNQFDNTLNGGAGDDILDGWWYSPYYAPVFDTLKTTGTDTLKGGAGNDTYRIDSGLDLTDESATTRGGIDTVEFKGAVFTASYTLLNGVENLKMLGNLTEGVGNNLNNRIFGDSNNNNLIGLYGDDYLDGGTGIDSFAGGYGDDTYVVDNISESITEKSGQGSDWVQSSTISLDLNTSNWGGSIENGRLTGTTSSLTLSGSAVNNTLIGNDGSNTLDGREGIDTLQGGLGDDVYVVDTLTDNLIEVPNVFDVTTGKIKTGYIDTIQSSINFSLDSDAYKNFENLTLLGAAKINATGNLNNNYLLGNDQANTLEGLAGDDILDGAGGIDTLKGGLGNDLYKLGIDNDIVVELAGEGTDTIESTKSLSLSDYNNVENLTLVGDAATGTGTKDNNVITGNNIANTLTGLAGADRLIGGEDADTLIGGLGADVLDLTESLAKNDTVVIAVGDSTAAASEADRVLRFDLSSDIIDLGGAIKIASNAPSVDGINEGGFNSHSITDGIIKFDDVDSYTSPVLITAANIGGAIDYLKANITKGLAVAFQGFAPDPNSTTNSQVYSTWIFQDNGDTDTLVALIGVTTATSLSTGGFSSTAIHLV
ncbi:MAG: calcium-binding protein [Methylovulum sp.]|nr:calcium-binding protein [Methylovulum sp.]